MLPPLLLRVTGCMPSSAMRAVVLLMRLYKLNFQLEKIPLQRGDVVEVNALFQGVVVRDGDVELDQTHAALRYLVGARSLPSTLYPTNHRERAAVDNMLDWLHSSLHRVTVEVLNATACAYIRNPARGINEEEMAYAMRSHVECLSHLEKHLQSCGREFLCGDALTLADISAASDLAFLKLMDMSLDSYPRLRTWYTRMTELSAWSETVVELHQAQLLVEEAVQKVQKAEQKKQITKTDAAGSQKAPDVSHTVRFDGSPHDVFEMLLDQDKLTAMLKCKCTVGRTRGSEFFLHDGQVSGTTLFVEADKKLLQRWRFSEWPALHFSMVRILLSPAEGGGTDLSLTQNDIPPDSIKRVDELWNTLFWRPLEGVLIRNMYQFIFFENASPHDIYDLFLDSSKLSRLTRTKCEISKNVGSEFDIIDGTVTGRNVQLITDTKIVQQWRAKDWPAGFYSTVTIEVARVAGGTDMKFSQVDIPVDKYAATVEHWERVMWKKTRKFDFSSLATTPAVATSAISVTASRAVVGGSARTGLTTSRVPAVAPKGSPQGRK